MDSGQQAAGIAGMILAMGFTFVLLVIAFYVLLVVAQWKMFTKAGVEGWKSIIPIYNTYMLFKIVWNTQSFWMLLGLGVIASILSAIGSGSSDPNIIIVILTLVACIALLVMDIKLSINMAKAYGKGIGFAIGLILLPNIFMLILGFGSAQYIGPQE